MDFVEKYRLVAQLPANAPKCEGHPGRLGKAKSPPRRLCGRIEAASLVSHGKVSHAMCGGGVQMRLSRDSWLPRGEKVVGMYLCECRLEGEIIAALRLGFGR